MAATPESKVKAKIHKILQKHNAYAVNYIGGMHANNGTPDILACMNGMFLGIEAKAGKNRPTDLQISNLRRIHEAGGCAMVINEDSLQFLDGILATVKIGGQPISNYEQYARQPTEETDAPRKRIKEK
jgi:hypothetical protein